MKYTAKIFLLVLNYKFIFTKGNVSHRINGPATKWYDDDEYWWQNGFLHRLDGPAIEYKQKRNKKWKLSEFYIRGKSYTEEEFNDYVSTLK